MKSLRAITVVSALLETVVAVTTCTVDDCVRAVVGTTRTQFPANIAQCSNLIACTFYPYTVTSTSTVTFTPSTTIVVTQTPAAVTVTSTISPGGTATRTVTITPAQITSTATLGSTTTITVTSYGAPASKRKRAIDDRPAINSVRSGTVSCPSTDPVPTFASTCGAFTKYSSACYYCGSVTKTIVTLATPTSTILQTVVLATVSVTTTSTLAPSTSTAQVTLASSTVTSTITLSTSTTTITVSGANGALTTSTVTSYLPFPTQCGNAGLQWAYYVDGQAINSQAQMNAFIPDIVKTDNPLVSGIVTSTFGFSYADTMNPILVYGMCCLPPDTYIINHRGFLFIPETGMYTFTINAINDLMYIWLGAVAYSGWNARNALQTANSNPANNVAGGPASFTQSLNAGTYLPIRIVYKQGASAAVLDYSIMGPSGQVLLGSSTATSNYAVQYSCDGVTAPQFPPFGLET